MIVVVTGQREWQNRQQVWEALDELLHQHYKKHGFNPHLLIEESLRKELLATFVLRHGKSGNVDNAANDWARARGVTVERFQAEWTDRVTGQVDYSAGPRRNKAMAQAEPRADVCLAFWDGTLTRRHGRDVSGTLDMIKVALQHGITVTVHPPKPTTP